MLNERQLVFRWKPTSSTLDNTSRLCEDSLASFELLDLVPYFITCVVRVYRRNAGLGVGECLRQPFDAVPVGLYSRCHNERIVGDVAPRRGGYRRLIWRERFDVLGDVGCELWDNIVDRLASVFLVEKSRANKSPSETFYINTVSTVWAMDVPSGLRVRRD
jgi:hypothetical protein